MYFENTPIGDENEEINYFYRVKFDWWNFSKIGD
jgi:hypothetical protein